MSPKTVIAALIFGVAVAAGGSLLTGQMNSKKPGVPKTNVVVVTQEVHRGTKLTKEMLGTKSVAKEALQPGTFKTVKDAVGRLTAVRIQEGILTDNFLVPKGAAQGLTSLIPKGKLAVTVPTPTMDSSVARLVQPGDHVDVQLTIKSRDRNDPAGGAQSLFLLHNLEVLAVDSQIEAHLGNVENPNAYKSVTLLATREQALRLNMGKSQGELQLVLRSAEADEEENDIPPLTRNELLGRSQQPENAIPQFSPETVQPAELPPTSPATVPTIVTFRGTSRGLVSLRPTQRTAPSAQPVAAPAAVASNNPLPQTAPRYDELDN